MYWLGVELMTVGLRSSFQIENVETFIQEEINQTPEFLLCFLQAVTN